MITKARNSVFTNNKTVGKYVDTVFSTMIQKDKDTKEQVRFRVKTHYFEKGKGKPLLLLHGALFSSYLFKSNIEELAEQYRVVVPDLPGHGYSSCPDMDYTIEDFSLFIEAFAGALGLERFSIVCYGQSAAYAFDFAYYNMDRVDKIIVMNPGPMANTYFTGAKLLGGMFGGVMVGRYANRKFIRKHLNKGFFDQTVLSEQDAVEFSRPFDNPDVRFSARLSISNFMDEEVLDNLSRLRQTVLFIEGEDDALSNPEDTRAYFEALQDVYTMEIRNCGAFPLFEKPDYVNRGILEFLKI